MWKRWFCEPCNGRTGRWEEEYTAWGLSVLLELQRQKPPVGHSVALEFDDADPGALARMFWAWMFAVDFELRAELPDIANAVLSGRPVEPPPGLRVVLGATTDLRLWLMEQRDGKAVRTVAGRGAWRETPAGIWTAEPEDVPLPRVAISSPPLVALLADRSHDPQPRYFDTSDWLNETTGERRPIAVLLPIVRAFDADETVPFVTYERLA